MTAALTPELAIAYVRELSADVRAVVVLAADGSRLAGPAALEAPARAYLAAAPAGADAATRVSRGLVLAARAPAAAMVVAAGPLSLVGPTALDARTALDAMAVLPAPRLPAGAPQAADGAPPVAGVPVAGDRVGARVLSEQQAAEAVISATEHTI